jgi:hypothetical protein
LRLQSAAAAHAVLALTWLCILGFGRTPQVCLVSEPAESTPPVIRAADEHVVANPECSTNTDCASVRTPARSSVTTTARACPSVSVTTPAEQCRDEGRAEGEAKGRAQGEGSGRAQWLLRQMQLKFGAVAAEVAAVVAAGSAEQHERWAERVLSATSAEDVIAL